MELAVYTCILPSTFVVQFQPPLYEGEVRDVDWWAISDYPLGVYPPWNDFVVDRDPYLSSRRDMQKYKMRSHFYFPDYDYVIWQDGSVRLKQHPRDILKLLLESGKGLLFGDHPWRDCSYAEAEEVKNWKQNNREVIEAQVARYREEGFPEHFGLGASTFFIRDNKDPKVCEFFELWLDETMKGSHRNQVSLGYALWKSGVEFELHPMRWNNNEYWGFA